MTLCRNSRNCWTLLLTFLTWAIAGLSAFGNLPRPCPWLPSEHDFAARGLLTNRTDGLGATLHFRDPNANVTNLVENGLTNSWTFDAYNRVTSYRDTSGNLIQYRFDANGN